MNDKTAIETIRALKRNAENDMPEYDYGWDAAIDEAIKALAALDAEKPVEDAESCLSKMFRDIRKIGYITEPLRLTNESHDACVYILAKFAASYHAEQCKACNDFCARAKEHCEDREAPLV